MKTLKLTAVMSATMLMGTLAPAQVFAQETQGTIGMLQSNGSGPVRFSLSSGAALCGVVGAGTPAHGEITVGQSGVTAEGAKTMLALLVGAKLAGKAVKVYANNGNGSVWGCSIFAVEIP